MALGEASRQRKLLELASFPLIAEMPQAEGRRARQEHGMLVARGLAEGVAKIVEEATFTDALGTEFGLGYKLQRPLQMGMAKVQKTPRKASSWS